MTLAIDPQAEKEKRDAALSSVVAAVFLTGLKLVVGIMTGSLGILAEAIHSGLDLVAALVTLFAVRFSDQPPDEGHQYGHGKVENLSALIETVLLLVTCVWIVYEAIQRLFFKPAEIEVSIWAFVVMGISIVVDISRSRVLSRAAEKTCKSLLNPRLTLSGGTTTPTRQERKLQYTHPANADTSISSTAPRAPGTSSPRSTANGPGRNDPCPCGSGKKYKKCCGA